MFWRLEIGTCGKLPHSEIAYKIKVVAEKTVISYIVSDRKTEVLVNQYTILFFGAGFI